MIRPLPWWVLAALVVLIAGCGGEPWQTKSVDGLLPPLEFTLRTDSGPFSAADVEGQAVLLTFGYASCPDVCPTTLARLAALVESLPSGRRNAVRVLFVSVDPQRDTPERLERYIGYFGDRFLAATGREAQLRALARRYRTTYSYGEPDANGFYEVAHSAGVYVFDRTGDIRLLFRPRDSLEAMRADLLLLLN